MTLRHAKPSASWQTVTEIFYFKVNVHLVGTRFVRTSSETFPVTEYVTYYSSWLRAGVFFFPSLLPPLPHLLIVTVVDLVSVAPFSLAAVWRLAEGRKSTCRSIWAKTAQLQTGNNASISCCVCRAGDTGELVAYAVAPGSLVTEHLPHRVRAT